MPEYPDTPDDLYDFAQALVRKLVKQQQLAWNEQRMEDATHDLFLAGWQVWCDTQDIGLAKHRMASRRHNLLRDGYSEDKHEPTASSDLLQKHVEKQNEMYDDDDLVAWTGSATRGSIRDDPVEQTFYRECVARLPPRRREVLLLHSAGYTVDEIVKESGIPKRTVERELSLAKKEQKHDQD